MSLLQNVYWDAGLSGRLEDQETEADDVQEFTTLDPVTVSNACDVRVYAHRLEI